MFDLLPNSPRLRAVTYNSRSNKPYDRSYHSFVGETACGRWAITKLRRYLWGKVFYWMCDCTAVKEILEYFGPVHQLQRWSQELMGYEYAFIHRPARMIRDVDDLSRRSGKCVAAYLLQTGQMRDRDIVDRPAAYSFDYFMQSPRPQRVMPTTTTLPQPLTLSRSESLVASVTLHSATHQSHL